MEKQKHKRSSFSGKLGFVLAAAGASVGPVSYTHLDVYKRQDICVTAGIIYG